MYKQTASLALAISLIGCAHTPDKTQNAYQNRQPPPPRATALSNKTLSPLTRPIPNTKYAAPAVSPDDTLGDYANRPEVRDFIQHMVQKYGFSSNYLTTLFANANQLNSVIDLEMGDGEPKGPPKPHLGSWTRYRAYYLTEEHIREGVEFWNSNAATIQKASRTYGVDPEYIVGIIGVETYFGRNIGKTCVFDALTTLAFDTPRRPKYFKTELENFLLMTREEGYEPREPVGSWAGAMGLGQFMPSSFRRLAVDFDHNGKRDLWQPLDAIGSVAHYFSKNGWQFNEPVTEQTGDPAGESTIDLSTYEGDEYWQTFHNFKVIKRYNNSKKYAMAVHQLAQAIKQRLPQAASHKPIASTPVFSGIN
jgi:membrane-bound lytic murein transglycosylase B